MEKRLKEIYFNTVDRIFLNNSPAINNRKTIREQIQKDEELKTLIEKVFENPDQYDVYYQKDTLQLCIDPMPEESGMKRNIFNRIEIEY